MTFLQGLPYMILGALLALGIELIIKTVRSHNTDTPTPVTPPTGGGEGPGGHGKGDGGGGKVVPPAV